ncbi:MAG TPA: hypothetical protein VJ907_06940 [Halanaerobiales bacterium]|nr:hypothetical protein [Halanaerobiales bacterium]
MRTIDKKRLKSEVAKLNGEILQRVDSAIEISLGLVNL